jgi:hypothetical protein
MIQESLFHSQVTIPSLDQDYHTLTASVLQNSRYPLCSTLENGNNYIWRGVFFFIEFNDREHLRTISLEDMRDEFNWYFDLATEGSIFPNHAVVIPKIQAVADLIFTPEFIYLDHSTFATELLNRTPPYLIYTDHSNSSSPFII